MTEISIREKEKWTNKGTDKQEMADSFLHNTTYHTQSLYKISSSYTKQFLRNFLTRISILIIKERQMEKLQSGKRMEKQILAI